MLPTAYFHVVFTLPEPIAAIAFYNKETVSEMLFRIAAQTLLCSQHHGLLHFAAFDPWLHPGIFPPRNGANLFQSQQL